MTGTIHIVADQTTTYTASLSATRWILDEGVSIHVESAPNALAATWTQSDRHFEINGSLIADAGTAFYLGGAEDVQIANTVFISSIGHLQAAAYGMLVYGFGNQIVNEGKIDSKFIGIFLMEEDATVENSGEIHATYEAVAAGGADHHLVNSGSITSDLAAGYYITATNSTLENTTGGTIVSKGAAADGVYMSGAISLLRNDGLIDAFYGVRLHDDDIAVENSGTIKGDKGVQIDQIAGDATIKNSGTIAGDIYAIVSIGDRTRITNTGVLDGEVLLGNSDDVLSTNGSVGDVYLSAGDDTFILRGGTCGTVDGGAGDDIFRLSAAASIIEAPAEGTDTVVANVTWALGDNLENLTLAGRRNSAGTGNELDNTLKGNRGENHLSGLSGDDELTGGRGADIFVYKTGGGTDTVTDFGNGADRIDLGGWGEVTSFADLKSHHVKTGHGDVIIQAGSGKLILLDTALSELDASDFLF